MFAVIFKCMNKYFYIGLDNYFESYVLHID